MPTGGVVNYIKFNTLKGDKNAFLINWMMDIDCLLLPTSMPIATILLELLENMDYLILQDESKVMF